jgi:hypothetical protein
MDEAFWKAWASREASAQWCIYGDRSQSAPPPVEKVEAIDGRFRVTFGNGDKLDVVPSSMARPVGLLAGPK